MTIARWVAVCRQRDRGRLFLDNLAVDLDGNHLNSDHLARFRAALAEALSLPMTQHSASDNDIFSYIGTAALTDSKLYLEGRIVTIPEEDLAFVFRLDSFRADLWFDFTDAGGYDQLSSPESILDLLGGIEDLAAIIRPSATLRGGLPMVWLTSFAELMSTVRDHPQAADAARNALGLLHYANDCYLCYIRVCPNDLNWAELRRPNAFDGGLSLVFRSNEVSEPTGRTIDLIQCRPMMPELVTAPIKLRSGHKPQTLGRLSAAAGFSWGAMCSSLVEARVAHMTQLLTQGCSNE